MGAADRQELPRLESARAQKKLSKDMQTKLQVQISSSEVTEDIVDNLKDRLVEFKKGWKKALPLEQKRLLRRTIEQLVFKDSSIAVFYYMADSNDFQKNGIDEKNQHFTSRGVGLRPFTKLQVQNLRNDEVGDAMPATGNVVKAP